jgi:Ca2+-binding EF-hand superfamily protein
MFPRLFLGAAVVTLVALAPLTAHAQAKDLPAQKSLDRTSVFPRNRGVDALLQQWDTDRDGTLSLEELKKASDARFDVLDKDHEGTLDKKELRGIVSAKEITKVDGDKDGTVDKAEYQALAVDRFNAADPDHDGTLDKKELLSRAGKSLRRMLQ